MGDEHTVYRTRGEPSRLPPGGPLSAKMSGLARKHTAPEVALRRELWSRGLRYRLHVVVPTRRRRTIDVAFPGLRLAVFIDGCFWHGCPAHGTRPQTNEAWWAWKIERNKERDRDTCAALAEDWWTVVRVWEHEAPADAAHKVEVEVRRLRQLRDEDVAPRGRSAPT